MINKKILTILLLGCFACIVTAGIEITQEKNTDRPGMDYNTIKLDTPDPGLCEQACLNDDKCKAYTYVKPGVQGNFAQCWLKSGIPDGVPSNDCVSGMKKEVKSDNAIIREQVNDISSKQDLSPVNSLLAKKPLESDYNTMGDGTKRSLEESPSDLKRIEGMDQIFDTLYIDPDSLIKGHIGLNEGWIGISGLDGNKILFYGDSDKIPIWVIYGKNDKITFIIFGQDGNFKLTPSITIEGKTGDTVTGQKGGGYIIYHERDGSSDRYNNKGKLISHSKGNGGGNGLTGTDPNTGSTTVGSGTGSDGSDSGNGTRNTGSSTGNSGSDSNTGSNTNNDGSGSKGSNENTENKQNTEKTDTGGSKQGNGGGGNNQGTEGSQGSGENQGNGGGESNQGTGGSGDTFTLSQEDQDAATQSPFTPQNPNPVTEGITVVGGIPLFTTNPLINNEVVALLKIIKDYNVDPRIDESHSSSGSQVSHNALTDPIPDKEFSNVSNVSQTSRNALTDPVPEKQVSG